MKLTEQLKKALSALAYAEAGEMLSAREKWQTLVPDSTAMASRPDLGKAISPRKLVALSLGSATSRSAVQYAISVCQRMGADLSVLCASVRVAETVLSMHQEAIGAASITCRTVVISGNHARTIKQYLQTHPQVMFIISSSADDPVQALISSGNWDKAVNVTSVPVVVAHDNREYPQHIEQPAFAALARA